MKTISSTLNPSSRPLIILRYNFIHLLDLLAEKVNKSRVNDVIRCTNICPRNAKEQTFRRIGLLFSPFGPTGKKQRARSTHNEAHRHSDCLLKTNIAREVLKSKLRPLFGLINKTCVLVCSILEVCGARCANVGVSLWVNTPRSGCNWPNRFARRACLRRLRECECERARCECVRPPARSEPGERRSFLPRRARRRLGDESQTKITQTG